MFSLFPTAVQDLEFDTLSLLNSHHTAAGSVSRYVHLQFE